MRKVNLKSILIALLIACVLFHWCESAFAQSAPTDAPLQGYSKVVPLENVTHDQVLEAVSSNTTIPMWDYSLTSPVNGVNYSGSMVGRSPFFQGARTTDIPT